MCILERGIRKAKRHPRSKRSLGVMAAVMLLYFNVSGGPIGAEPIISAAGPLVGLVGLCVFPFVWSIQISLMTAELSSAFPSNGGYSVWVTEVCLFAALLAALLVHTKTHSTQLNLSVCSCAFDMDLMVHVGNG